MRLPLILSIVLLSSTAQAQATPPEIPHADLNPVEVHPVHRFILHGVYLEPDIRELDPHMQSGVIERRPENPKEDETAPWVPDQGDPDDE